MTHTPSLPGDVHDERTIVPGETRKPLAGHLNYGPLVETPHPFEPLGPNTLGERVWPVTVERSATRTRIGFAFQFPTEIVRKALDEQAGAPS